MILMGISVSAATLPTFSGGTGTSTQPILGQIPVGRADGTYGPQATSTLGIGGVSSVSSSDGTLTISPTIGNIIASLALTHANTWTGKQTFNNAISISGATSQLHNELDVDNNISLLFLGGGSGCTNTTGIKTGSDGTFLFDAGCSLKFKGGSGLIQGFTDGSFNYVWQNSVGGTTTQNGGITFGGALSPNSNAGVSGQLLQSLGNGSYPTWVNAPIVSTSSDYVNQTGAITILTLTSSAATSTYDIGGYVTINAVTTDVAQFQFTYTNEKGTSITNTFYPMGLTTASLSTTGTYSFPNTKIRVAPNTTITGSVILTTGIGTINLDAGATIQQISNK